MNRKLLLLVCFVFLAGLGGLAQAGTPIDVNNWSFEFDDDGNQIYCHAGMGQTIGSSGIMAWGHSTSSWAGVDPYCLGDTDYDPCSLTMVCTPEECYTDDHSGCHCWAALHGISYNYTQAANMYIYNELDPCDPNAIITIGRQYTFTLDAMSEIYKGTLDNLWIVPGMFYGQGGDSNHVEVANKEYLLKIWIGDLNEWEREWEPNLTVKWVATENHPALGKVLGIKVYVPSAGGPVRAYGIHDRMRVEWDWAVAAYNPTPADQTDDVARDVNLGWAPGLWAARHVVYFHEDFNKVDGLLEDANQGIQDPNTWSVLNYDSSGLDLATTYYWRIKEVNEGFVNPGGIPDQPWTGDVWSFTVTGYAQNPNPADYATGIPHIGTVPSWTPGTDSNSHDVYFGTDFDDVNDANTTVTLSVFKGNQNGNSYDPNMLMLGKRYYWRIDEVNELGGTLVKGRVWQFTISEYFTMEDFDGYANTPALLAVWDDYWANDSGAEVTRETIITADDGNSMAYDYDNRAGDYNPVASRTFGTGDNWLAGGLETLTLYVRGKVGNSPDPMYVEITDGSGVTAKAAYPDPNELAIEWKGFQEWNIALQDFVDDNSVDLTDIEKLAICFGDKTPRGTGTVYFDNIRLYPARCIPAYAHPTGSFDWDCVIDSADLRTMAKDWLLSGIGNVTASAPSGTPVACWKMDDALSGGPNKQNVVDSCGSYLGLLQDPDADPGLNTNAHHDADSVEGTGSLTFDGVDDYIDVNTPLNLNSNTVTISAWIKRDGEQDDYKGIVACHWTDPCDSNLSTGAGFGFGSGGTYGFRDWGQWEANNELSYAWSADTNEADFDWTWDFHTGLIVPDIEWVFIALVIEPTKATVYMYDGDLHAARNYMPHNPERFNGPLHIGEQMQHPNRYFKGNIDDVAVYNYSMTPAEILYLALQGSGSEYVELVSWRADVDDDDTVNFKDYATVADNWLEEVLWPTP